MAGLPGRAAAHPGLVMSLPGPAGRQEPPGGGFWLSRQPHPPVAGPLIKLTATSDPQLLARVLAGLRNLP